jgi:hypothetical protein
MVRRALTLKHSVPLVLFAFFNLLYLTTRSRVFSYDGICYALDVEFGTASKLLHPQHIFFGSLSWLLFHFAQAIGYGGRAITVMQVTNASVAALAVALLYVILVDDLGRRKALGGACFLGVSHVLWYEATDPGCYAWAALATCLLLGLFLREKKTPAFWIGVGHGVAVLFHQMIILAVPAFLIRIGFSGRSRKRVAVYAMGGAIVLAIAYGATWIHFHQGPFSRFVFWITHPADAYPDERINYWWHLNPWENIVSLWRGFSQSLIAPVPTSSPSWRLLAQVLQLSLVAGLGLLGLRWIAAIRRWDEEGLTALSLAIWIVGMSIFQAFYVSGRPPYRLLFLPALIYAALSFMKQPIRRAWWILSLVFLAAMALINFQFSIHPRLQPDAQSQRVQWLRQQVHEADYLIFAGSGDQSVVNVYMAYFAPDRAARSLKGYFFGYPGGELQNLTDSLKEVKRRHGKIYMEDTLWSDPVQSKLESRAQIPSGTVSRWLGLWRVRRTLTGPNGYQIVEVERR